MGRQVDLKQRRLESLLADAIGERAGHIAWEPPLISKEAGFRSKAKMVVAGTVSEPTLGILDAQGRGVDLVDCQLHDERIVAVLPAIRGFVTTALLTPYDVPTRTGELKHVIVTVAPSGELMIRFVLRSTEAIARLRKHLPALTAAIPTLRVVSANILPEHKAVLEGERELALSDAQSLPMTLGQVTLHVQPQSFFQTNAGIAQRLYAQAAAWVDAVAPRTVWDLYCGVGGFALHCIAPGRTVTGVEISERAIASASESAALLAAAGHHAAAGATFIAADATAWAAAQEAAPDVVIVNPPRRGIGPDLAAWLEGSGVSTVVYSSCNAVTLAKDLQAMPSLRPVAGALLDMFPHTEHFEAVLLLKRTGRAASA